jgi:hypothetical protein
MVARAYWQGVSDGLLDHLLGRRQAGIIRRAVTEAAALAALLGLFAGSIIFGSRPASLSLFLRAARRWGLLLSGLHLAGDWQQMRDFRRDQQVTAPAKQGIRISGREE